MSNLPSDFLPIKSYIKNCLDLSAMKGIRYYGIQSIDLKDVFNNLTFISIPYIYYMGENRLPTIDNIEKTLTTYIDSYFDECIQNFSVFKEIGFDIEESKNNISSQITSEKIVINMKYPLSVNKDNIVHNLLEFRSEIELNMNKVYNALSEFLTEQDENPDYIPIGYIGVLSSLENINIEMINFPEDTVLYIFKFNELMISNEAYIFSFAIKYNWSDLRAKQDDVRRTIDKQYANVDYIFDYTIASNISNPIYVDYSYLFDINQSTGEIKFTPRKEDTGIHDILIKIYNDTHHEFVRFTLEIISDNNNAPNLERIEDKKLNIGETLNFSVNAFDPDGDEIFYNIEKSLSNLHIHLTNGEITYQAIDGQQGLYTIKVIVVDINTNINETTFNLEVKSE
jgi:hypothetical protein